MVLPDDVQAVFIAVAQHRLLDQQRSARQQQRNCQPAQQCRYLECSLGKVNTRTAGAQAYWRRFFPAAQPQLAPCALSRRTIYILPNRSGLLFAVVLLTLLIGAINYNLALGHALVFLLAALGLVSMVHAFRNLHGLTLAPQRATPVFAGDTAQFELAIDNPTSRPRYALRLWATPELPLEFALAAQHRQTLQVALPASRRGWLELPRVRLEKPLSAGSIQLPRAAPGRRCDCWSIPVPVTCPCPR